MKKKDNNTSFISYLKKFIKISKNKKNIIIFIILVTIEVIFSIFTPICEARIITNLTDSLFEQVFYYILIYYLLRIFFVIIDRYAYKNYLLFSKDFKYNLKNNLAKEILKLNSSIVYKSGSGLFITRLTSDINSLDINIINIIYYASDIFIILGSLITIFIVNKIAFIYVLITYIILILLNNHIQKKIIKKEKELDKYRDKISSFENEITRGIQDIKMLNSEHSFLKELKNKNMELFSKGRDVLSYKDILRSLLYILRNIIRLGSYIIIVILLKDNIVNGAYALVLYNYIDNCFGYFKTFDYVQENIREFKRYASKIMEILDGSNDFYKEEFGRTHLNKIIGDFEFKNVCFSYDNDKEVLHNLSFKVKHNTTVGFVGKSGAGKTTIFNLLCKMYDINSGEILIDNHNIKDLDRESIRGNITIISQDPYIFNLSIKDNFKIVKEDISDDEIRKACKLACLDDYIETLPDKYDTIVGEGGVRLSGGQKQRLAIARALVQKTEIILFDEATSALDNITQKQIQTAIDNLQGEYTIMIIAHRLSTIKNCDKIYYIENGCISASGTHEYLLKNSEGYRNLYNDEIEK